MIPDMIALRRQKLATAHKMMQEYGVRHLPVLRGGELVGVLSHGEDPTESPEAPR